MTSSSLAVTCLMFALLVPSGSGNDLNSMLNSFVQFAISYEYGQTSTASSSYNQYEHELPAYLQEAQHGDSLSAENMALASRYIFDVALLLNAQNLSQLRFDNSGADNFTNFVDESVAFVCPQTACDTTEIYRRMNDTCNNVNNPLQGAAFTTQQRYNNGTGNWEKTSLVDYILNQVPGFYFDTRGVGVTPKLKDYPFIFKVRGNAPFRLSVFSTENGFKVTDEQYQCSGNPCRITVPGAIYSVSNKNICTVNDQITFTEFGNMVEIESGSCTSNNYTVRYYRYLAHVTIQPESSTIDSVLSVPGQADDSSPDNKFANESPERYWLNIGADQSVNISSGTEYSISEVFLTSNLGLTSAPNLKRLFVSVGIDDASTVTSPLDRIQLVNRKVYEVCTSGNVPVLSNHGLVDNLDTIPFTYDYYTFRWGINHPDNGIFNVTMTSRDNTTLTLSVNMGNLTNSFFEYSGTSVPEVADFTSITLIDYETMAGEKFGGHDSFYLAWHYKWMYFGYGNEIGRNLITTQALEMTDLERFGATEIVLSSSREACWVIDIEQRNEPRRSSWSTGEELPSSLDPAMLIHASDGSDGFSTSVTIATFQMGQYVDHDIIATPLATIDGHAPICCSNFEVVNDTLYTDEICYEIPINNNYLTDTELSPFTTSLGNCLEFGRSGSAFSCNGDWEDFRVLHQLNIITTRVDASNVYGSSDAEATALRNSSSAGLAVQYNPFTEQPELPVGTSPGEACTVNDTKTLTVDGVTKDVFVTCPHAGDFRAIEQSSLSSMHTLFVREHNRIAEELKNHGYSDSTSTERDELFQVTRHIIGGINQVIVFQHWLDSFLSNDTMNRYNLRKQNCGYNYKLNGAMQNLFGDVLRFGHTWIPEDLMGDPTEASHPNAYSSILLKEDFFDATPIYEKGSDFVMSNWHKACPNTDRFMGDAVMKHLFGVVGGGDADAPSTNLAALNIQRGRDHGLPTYRDALNIFKNKNPNIVVPSSIDEILDLGYITSDVHQRVKRLYPSIDDIDIFTGALMEQPTDSTTSVGHVINNVIGDMFNILRKTDRFWYACYFSGPAKRELEKVTLGRIMCDNIKDYSDLDTQRDLFRVYDATDNPTISCANRPSMDFSKFSKANNGGRNLARFPGSGSGSGSSNSSSSSTREEPVNLTDGMMKLMRELDEELKELTEREEENDD